MQTEQSAPTVEMVPAASLKPHPRNYRAHPDDQLEHLEHSIREHGFYRNVVIARDGTILAGHGVVQTARKMGIETVPAIRLDLEPDDPRALKVLIGDNEIAHLGEIDDRELTELLKEIKDVDLDGLLGTGYDELMLANLLFVTRPASEIADHDAAAQWVGMPEYEEGSATLQVIVSFRDQADRAECLRVLGLNLTASQKSTWWPPKEREDLASMRFAG